MRTVPEEALWSIEIKYQITTALDALNAAHIAVKWEWSRRMTSTVGMAYGRLKRVVFSRPQWPRMTPQQRWEAVVHEVCHIVAYQLHHEPMGHGPVWEGLMKQVGVEPEVYHSLGPADAVAAQCGCHVRQISSRMATRIKRGNVRVCRYCKRPLELL